MADLKKTDSYIEGDTLPMALVGAIGSAFQSPNEVDSNFEEANVVDGLFAIARAIDRLAKAVSDQ